MTIKLFVPEFDWGDRGMIEIFSISRNLVLEIHPQASEYFVLVESPELSDWIIVPAFLSSLTQDSGKSMIRNSALLAQKLGKPLGVFSNSDLIVDPGVSSLYIFTPGAYSTLPNQIELPAVLPYDPVLKWMKGNWYSQTKRSLGFCGQATQNPLKTIKDYFKLESLRLQKKKGNSPFLHIPKFLPAFERSRVLSRLSKSSLIETDFVLRSHYRGGANTQESIYRVEMDFFQNIASNLFTLCMRGMGNYSVRFYQTLAMGRIPVLIDTESVLPFASHIEYSGLLLSVPYENRFETDRYILDFLKDKSQEELDHIQLRCRSIWLDNFQTDGMIRNLAVQMQLISEKSSTPRL